MTQLRWHERMKEAIRELGDEKGFRTLDPCVVYFRGTDDRRLFYKPDCCWIYGRTDIGLVI